MGIAHADLFTVYLEIGHAYFLICKINGKETVCKLLAFLGCEELAAYLATLQTVFHFTYLHEKVSPFVRVVGFETTTLASLCNSEISSALCIGSTIEETEICV